MIKMKMYLDLLRFVESNNKKLFCIYCGTETYVLNNIGICSNCENIISLPSSVLIKQDPEAVSKISAINEKLSNQNITETDFEEAIKIYDELIAKKNNLGYLYAKALLLIKYSNYLINQINYNKQGFMDENSELNEKSIKLVSDSKLLLYKIISTCNANINSNINSFNEIYLMFLANIKLNNFKAAQSSLNLIKNFNEIFILEYSQLIFNIAIKNYENATNNAKNLLMHDNFSINALFYYSFVLFNKKEFKQSKNILQQLQKYIKNDNIKNLIQDIAIKQNL